MFYKVLLGIPKHMLRRYPSESTGLKQASFLLLGSLLTCGLGCVFLVRHIIENPFVCIPLGIALGMMTGFIIRFAYITQRPDILKEETDIVYSSLTLRLLICFFLSTPAIFGWSFLYCSHVVEGVDNQRVAELSTDYRASLQPSIDPDISTVERHIVAKDRLLTELQHELSLKEAEAARLDSSSAPVLQFEIESIRLQMSTAEAQKENLRSDYQILEAEFNKWKNQEVLKYVAQLRKQHFLASEMKALMQNPITIFLAILILSLHGIALVLHQRILFREDSKFYNHMIYHDRAVVRGYDRNTVEKMTRDLLKFGYKYVDRRPEFHVDPPFDDRLILSTRIIVDDDVLNS